MPIGAYILAGEILERRRVTGRYVLRLNRVVWLGLIALACCSQIVCAEETGKKPDGKAESLVVDKEHQETATEKSGNDKGLEAIKRGDRCAVLDADPDGHHLHHGGGRHAGQVRSVPSELLRHHIALNRQLDVRERRRHGCRGRTPPYQELEGAR